LPTDNRNDQNLADSVTDITEKLSLLVREEIELAKAEVSEKVNSLVKATVVGLAAGIFIVVGLLFLLHSLAWGLFAAFFDNVWTGYLVTALILFALGGLAGWLAAKWFKRGSPPVPNMAIDEAKAIQATFSDKPGLPERTST
jgi:uncharacterized membrane protein YqjE